MERWRVRGEVDLVLVMEMLEWVGLELEKGREERIRKMARLVLQCYTLLGDDESSFLRFLDSLVYRQSNLFIYPSTEWSDSPCTCSA